MGETSRSQGQRLMDYCAALVFQLWIAGVGYKIVGMRLERFVAKQKLRTRLRSCLQSPFRATFKERAFLRESCEVERPMKRSFSGQFLPELSAEKMESFKEPLGVRKRWFRMLWSRFGRFSASK